MITVSGLKNNKHFQMEAVQFSEMSVSNHLAAQCNKPESHIFYFSNMYLLLCTFTYRSVSSV